MAHSRIDTRSATRILDLWSDRLRGICIITTSFAAIDATLLKLTANWEHNHKENEKLRPIHIGLLCGLALYTIATGISFAAGCVAAHQRIRLLQDEQQDAFEMGRFSVPEHGARYADPEGDEKMALDDISFIIHPEQNIEGAYLSYGSVRHSHGQHSPGCTCCDLEGAPGEGCADPNHAGLSVWLFSALYQVCQLLAIAGVMVSLVGIMCAARG